MAVLQAIALILTAAGATVVVLVREPKRQVFLYMMYGLMLTILFALLQAPDVALSELAVGSVAIPFAILATLVRMEHGRK
ncbi:MAG: Na(+)/H(+) antiporter subunit B [Candidatus Velthaea sp.]